MEARSGHQRTRNPDTGAGNPPAAYGGAQCPARGTPAPSGTDSSLQQARAVAGEVTARLQALPLSDGQRYILASSLRPAPRNPFTLPANGLPDAQQAASANASGLVYSGYVQAGKEALAIIGGLEYGVGDTLPNTGDVIRFIGSDGVRLYSPSRNAEWTLPYSGDDI